MFCNWKRIHCRNSKYNNIYINNKTNSMSTTLSIELSKENDSSLVSLQKISMMYKNITHIGNYIPAKFYGVTRLFLSNNKIQTLSGIEQFKNLTHLSIAYNLIDDIDEFDKIYDKLILISLSVKGNFFCKNPHSNIILIQKFPKIKNLDGFKISEATYKVIEETNQMTYNIMNFFSIMEHKIEKVKRFSNLISLNNEFDAKCANELNNAEAVIDKMNRIKLLLKLNNFDILNSGYIEKYMNKNINPSVHVMKKIINRFLTEDLNKNNGVNEKRKIYEAVFDELISLYESKNNYNELPFYLNYLLLKACPFIEQFLYYHAQSILNQMKVKSNGKISATSFDINNYLYRNLPQLLTDYSNCTKDQIKRFQLMMFYKMNNGEETVILLNRNPYIENGKMILDELIAITCKFLCCYNPDCFPLFSLNFDYMRNLTTVIQNKIESYNEEFYIINNILNGLNEYKKQFQLVTIKKPSTIVKKNKSRSKSNSKEKNNYKSKYIKEEYKDELFKYNFADNYYSQQQRQNSKNRSKSNKSNNSDKSNIDFTRQGNTNIKLIHPSTSIKEVSQINNIKKEEEPHIVDRYYESNFQTKPTDRTKKESQPSEIKIQSPVNNELFTLSGEPMCNINTNSLSNSNRFSSSYNSLNNESPFTQLNPNIITHSLNDNANMKNEKIKRLSNICKGVDVLSYIIHKNIYTKFNSQIQTFFLRSNIIQGFIKLQNIELYLLKKTFFYSLIDIVRKYESVLHIKKKYTNIILMKALKENYLISKYESSYYYLKLKSKSLYGLYQNRIKGLRKKQMENKVLHYYYNKLLKKLFLTLKFNYQHSKEPQIEDEEMKSKIYNFFHNEEDVNAYDKYKELLNHNFSIQSLNDSEIESNPKSASVNKVDDLISHLENRYKELRTKLNKDKSSTVKEAEKENSKSNYDISKEYSEKVAKKNIKKIKKTKKVCVTCPYCVSKIYHTKCIGYSNNEGGILLGAPTFTRHTNNFFNKNL